MAFAGFTREGLQFLADLAANNERAWFAPRKADYERLLKHPLEALCVELGERFAARNIPLVADPARSPFRIYRDTRFSKDKSPYKPYVSASFPWRDGGPGGYFSLRPGEIYIGGGLWHPEPPVLAAWRAAVATRPAEVHAAPLTSETALSLMKPFVRNCAVCASVRRYGVASSSRNAPNLGRSTGSGGLS